MAGADALALHLRSDRRHTQERDVNLVRELAHSRLFLSLAPAQEGVKFVYACKPTGVTLVPERHDEPATEGGLDVLLDESHLRKVVRALQDTGVETGVLIEPDIDQVKATSGLGVEVVVLNTRAYADTSLERESRDELDRLEAAARVGRKLGMRVRAAHGLMLRNLAPLAAIKEIAEVEAGHGLVARAVFVGLEAAVREAKAALSRAS
jgi:pyridoxine 5-phosphate synthase